MKNFIKNIFSLKLYLAGLKRIRAIGIAAAICVIIPNAILPIIASIQMADRDYSSYYDVYDASPRISDVSYGGFAPFLTAMMIFAPIMVYLMFSYLNERKKSDFYHSMPQKRECVYTSFILAVVTWIVAVVGISVLFNSIAWEASKYYDLDARIAIDAFVYCLAGALLVAALMMFAMTLSGSTLSNLLVFSLIIIFPIITAALFIDALDGIVPIFTPSSTFLKYFEVDSFFPERVFLCFVSGVDDALDIGILIFSLVSAFMLLISAGFIYKYRRSEMAGQSAPNRILQVVYSTAVSAPFLFGLTLVFVWGDDPAIWFLILVTAALIVYMMFELMMTKKLKLMLRSMKFFCIPVALSVLFFGSVYATKAAVESVTPDPDEIEYVTVAAPDEYRWLSSQIDYPYFYGEEITDAATIEMVSSNLKEQARYTAEFIYNNFPDGRHNHREIVIKLKNGMKITRKILFTSSEINQFKRALANSSDEYKNKLIALPNVQDIGNIEVCGKYITQDMSDPNFNILMSCLQEDYIGMTEEEKLEYVLLTPYQVSYHYSFDIGFEDENGEYQVIKLLITSQHTPKTYEYIVNNSNYFYQ